MRREIAGAVEHFAGHLHPVVVERGLHLRDDGTLDAEMHVSPVVGILRVAHPLVGDADAAGECDPAVDHQQLAMGAIVEAVQVIPLQWTVLLDVDATILHFLQQVVLHLDAAGPVDGDVDLDPCLRALLQCIGELLADLPRPVDVRLEGDGLLRTADRLQHRREDLVAVVEVDHMVAGDDARAEQHPHFAPELRVVDGVAVFDLAVEFLLGRREVHHQHGREGGHQGGQEDCPEHTFSAPAHSLLRLVMRRGRRRGGQGDRRLFRIA